MKIDSHQHFWKYNAPTFSWITDEMATIRKDFSPQDLKPVLLENGFSGCVAVQADQSEAETEHLLKLAEEHDFIKGVVGWVDLCSPNVGKRLKYFSSNSFLKGIRHTAWDDYGEFMTAPDFQRGIEEIGNFDLTFDILVFDYQLASAIELVKAFPEQKFVLDHMGKPRISGTPDSKWSENIRKLARYKNVWCKISGLVNQTRDFKWKEADFSPFLGVVKEAFGVERLMFGSDWPVCLSAATYPEVLDIVQNFTDQLSEDERGKIYGENANEFYNLKL